jgi:oxalate decarboxylase
MRFLGLTAVLFSSTTFAAVIKRDSGFKDGQPIDANGKGAPILGMFNLVQFTSILGLTGPGGTNHQIDLDNPSNLGEQSTDSGTVPNLKWRFSDSKTKIFNGGWVREQVVQDLPQSHDIAAAQQHLKKGAIRELHWHRVVSRLFMSSRYYLWFTELTLAGGVGFRIRRPSTGICCR